MKEKNYLVEVTHSFTTLVSICAKSKKEAIEVANSEYNRQLKNSSFEYKDCSGNTCNEEEFDHIVVDFNKNVHAIKSKSTIVGIACF